MSRGLGDVYKRQTLNPAFTHSGFEKVMNKETKILDSADFHHQLHHRYYDCNYGNMDVPLDVWLGTHHDGTEEATKNLRMKKRNAVIWEKYNQRLINITK